jgi:hypothetical protein
VLKIDSETIGAVQDPLGYSVDLPIRETFYPMGYAVEIRTNSTAILDAASNLWKTYSKLSDADPVRISAIMLEDADESVRVPTPPRGNEHLFVIVHGPSDFAVADLRAGFGSMFLSRRSVADPRYLRYYFLEPLTYMLQAAAHFVFVHASCISLRDRGVVLCGESGAGKTCLAYACARRGWDFVSGDAVHVVRNASDQQVIGRPFEIRFRSSAQDVFRELQRFRTELRASGKTDLEIDTRQLGLGFAAQTAAHAIVFIERSHRTRIEREDREQAIDELQKTICFGDEGIRAQQHRALDRFAELPIWRLFYGDFDKAEQILRSLLEAQA